MDGTSFLMGLVFGLSAAYLGHRAYLRLLMRSLNVIQHLPPALMPYRIFKVTVPGYNVRLDLAARTEQEAQESARCMAEEWNRFDQVTL